MAEETPAPDDDELVEEVEEGAPAWVMTFADLVTLLMVFFILLFAMGSIEDEKFKQLKESLKAALGTDQIPEAGSREGLDVVKDPDAKLDESTVHAVDEVGAMVAKEMEEIASEVEEFVYKNKLAGQVEVSSDERGSIITISDVVLFPAGKARMTFAGKKTMNQVFDLLKQFNYDVKIEGHTDSSPIRTEKFPSNWELSASRAADVARMLVESGFPPKNSPWKGLRSTDPKYPTPPRRIELSIDGLKLFTSVAVSAKKWWMSCVADSLENLSLAPKNT